MDYCCRLEVEKVENKERNKFFKTIRHSKSYLFLPYAQNIKDLGEGQVYPNLGKRIKV